MEKQINEFLSRNEADYKLIRILWQFNKEINQFLFPLFQRAAHSGDCSNSNDDIDIIRHKERTQ